MERDWKAAKDVLRFLKGSTDRRLVFCKSDDEPCIIGHSDSDWAGSRHRKSASGYVFRTNQLSAFVSWKSRKQSIVALSSCESEHVAMAHATQVRIFLQNLFPALIGTTATISLFVDNQGAVALSKNKIS